MAVRPYCHVKDNAVGKGIPGTWISWFRVAGITYDTPSSEIIASHHAFMEHENDSGKCCEETRFQKSEAPPMVAPRRAGFILLRVVQLPP